MAVTLSETTLQQLVDAYLLGALRVTTDGSTVEYRSRDEMRNQIRELASALGVPDPLGSSSPGFRQIRVTTRKGW